MSGGSHCHIYDHAGNFAELVDRTEILVDVAARLQELGVDEAARGTRELLQSLGQWEASAVRRAGRLALVWRALDLHDSGDISEEAVRAAGHVYTAGRKPPARYAQEDPVSYLREALDAHERAEHGRRTLRLDAPGVVLLAPEDALHVEGVPAATPEELERYLDPAPDPFVLAEIAGKRIVLEAFAADAVLIKGLERDGEAYGMTIRAMAVRMELIQAWAAAYAARQEG